MRFSVIVPSYNNAKWIGKCLESIISQTYQDFEIVVVDDMSTDNSVEIIKKYLRPQDKLIINKTKRLNGGTRNVGIGEAIGEYVISIDCDDWFIDNKVFEDINNKLNGEDILLLDYICHTPNGDSTICQHYDNAKECLKGCSCALWTKVVKREYLLKHLQKEGTLFEDQGQHYRLLSHTNNIAYLGRTTHIWNRFNANSISNMDRWVFYRFNFCGEMYELIKETEDGELREYFKDVLKLYLKSCNEMVDKL